MNTIQKQYKSILLLAGCFFFFLSAHAQNWDIKLLDNINPNNPSSTFWKTTSSSVYPIALISPMSILATGYLKKDNALKQKGWAAVGSLVVSTAISQGMKYAFDRERPSVKYPLLIHSDNSQTTPSFPSGHTSTAFTTAASLSIHFKKWYVVVPAYTWAASVGYSRMYLGEHYPTDVFAGAVVGVGSAYLGHWLNKKIFKKK